MAASEAETDRAVRERAQIVKSGRLHWFHWAVVALSLVVTLAAWQFSRMQVAEKTEQQFQRAAGQVVELVKERMQKYEEGLWGGVAAIQSRAGKMSQGEWRTFSQSLRIDLRYPGINGIGVIYQVRPENLAAYLAEQRRTRPGFAIRPEHGNADLLPITYIEPEETNAPAVGLDVAHETNRYEAALKARDSGTAQITGPIVLVQDDRKTPGFLFYAPFYADIEHATVAENRERFIGMVYAPFVFHKLIEGALDKLRRQVRIRVSDAGTVLYDETDRADGQYDPDPMFTTELNLELNGRTWAFDIWTTEAFRRENGSDQPAVILAGGFLIDALLLALFVLLTRANRRAISFVDTTTAELRKKTVALQQTNDELESFAYVASHDLKAPLRGIASLAAWIEEDLGSLASDEVKSHIRIMHGRIHRMEKLLADLLQYSRAGRDNADPEAVDPGHDLPALFRLLSPPEGFRLEVASDMPKLFTARAAIEQVFRNLLGNAVKHHDGAAGAIRVAARDLGPMYEFTVSDDGPGIAPEFHKKIFGIFQTLKSRDELEASGIGLSIVSRIVRSVGGSVTVESDPGRDRGTAFRFTWPKQWHAPAE